MWTTKILCQSRQSRRSSRLQMYPPSGTTVTRVTFAAQVPFKQENTFFLLLFFFSFFFPVGLIQALADRKDDSYQYPKSHLPKMHYPRIWILVYLSVWLAVNMAGDIKSRAFISGLRRLCTVALNRPPTQNGDHINPPDMSVDGNTNVYFWGAKKQAANGILIFVEESGQALTCMGYFWRLFEKNCGWCKSRTATDAAALKVASLDFVVKQYLILHLNVHDSCMCGQREHSFIHSAFPEKERKIPKRRKLELF